MGATFKPVVKTRRKDGSRTVYIRVTYGRVSRHIPTTLTATPADLTRSGKIRNATILDRADEIILTMRGTLAGLSPFTLEGWTVDDLVRHIRDTMRGQDFRLDFFEFADAYIASSSLAVSTRGNYVAAVNALARYLGRRSLDVNEITRGMLLGFVDFLNNEPKMYWTKSTGELKATGRKKIEGMGAAMYVRKLAHIFRAARERYNDEDAGRIVIPRQPFDGIRIQTPPHCGQTSIGAETMQRVIDAVAVKPRERIALDIFVVSFCLMGANLADLWAAATPSGDVWEYNRQKTRKRRQDGAYMRVTVPRCAAPFIARLREGNAQSGGLWLPALRGLGKDKEICTSAINKALRRWQKREGLPDFTYYAARHTWATLARRAGVEKATVDECLAHVGDFDLTDIYAERSWDLIDAANEKVLALFRWPG